MTTPVKRVCKCLEFREANCLERKLHHVADWQIDKVRNDGAYFLLLT